MGFMKMRLITLRKASEILNIPENEILDLAKNNKIPHYFIGGEFIRFRKEDLIKAKENLYKALNIKPRDYTLTDRLKDFFYYNDFYIFSSAIIIFLCVIIFK